MKDNIIQFGDKNSKVDDNQLYTLSQIQKSPEITKVEKMLEQYSDDATALIVTNQIQYNDANDFCKNIKTEGNKLEQKRKFFANPYYRVFQQINKRFKEPINRFSEIETVIKNKMLKYHTEQERIAKKERERIEKQNQKKIEKFETKVEDNPDKDYMPPVLKTPTIEVEKTSKTENATATVKKIPKWRIKNFDEIPREYLTVDTKKMDSVVKAGIQVPGIEIYMESSLAIR